MADAPILVKWSMTLPLWHVDAVEGGGVHPIAFIGGAAFALSDLPKRISVFYVLLAPLLFVPIILLRKKAPTRPPRASPLDDFSKDIERWPPEQAQIALELVKAMLQGDRTVSNRLYPMLTVEQLKTVVAVIQEMEAGQHRET